MVTPRNSEPVTRKLLGHLGQEILSHPFIGDTYHYALFQEFQFFSRLSDVWIFVNRKIRRLDTPATLMSLPDTWLWESQAIHLKLFHCVLFFFPLQMNKKSPQIGRGGVWMRFGSMFPSSNGGIFGAKHVGLQEDIVLAEALVPLVNEWTRTLLEQKAGHMVDPRPSLYIIHYFEGFRGGLGKLRNISTHHQNFEIYNRGFWNYWWFHHPFKFTKWFEADFVFTGTSTWISI